jgi:hypothetical protein
MVEAGDFLITQAAFEGASRLGFDSSDIADCVLTLGHADFYKTMASTARVGLMQDVYRPRYLGVNLYVKLQLDERTRAVVISFKQDESR